MFKALTFSKDPYFWSAFLIVLLLTLWRANIADAITGDVAMYLECGRLILDGQICYVDFIDLNPPLIFFISVLPALLTKYASVPILISGNLACGALAVLSLILTNAVLARCQTAFGPHLKGAVLMACATLSACVTYDFGQREHLVALVWIPYFFLRASSSFGLKFPPWLAFLVGFFAGLGICLKHYFLLLPILLELTLLACGRRRQTVFGSEWPGLLLAPLLYALGFSLLPTAARNYFFDCLVPMLIHGYSGADKFYDLSYLAPLQQFWLPTDIFMLVVFVSFIGAQITRKLQKQPSLPWDKGAATIELALLVQIAAGFFIVQLQHKGWCYHAIPMMVAGLVLMACNFVRLTEKFSSTLRLISALAIVVIFVAFSSFFLERTHAALRAEWQDVLPQLAPRNGLVAYLDTTDTPWYVQTDRLNLGPGCRYLYLFPLSIYENLRLRGKVDSATVDNQMAKLVNEIGADLEKRQTGLVVVKTRHCYTLPDDFDLLEYLDRVGLKQALKNYRQVRTVGNYVFFMRRPIVFAKPANLPGR